MKWGCKYAVKETGCLQVDISLQKFFMWGRAVWLPVWLSHCLASGLGLVEAEPRAAVGLGLQRSCQRKEQAGEGFLLQEYVGLHMDFTS